jgi:carbonic anhydrase
MHGFSYFGSAALPTRTRTAHRIGDPHQALRLLLEGNRRFRLGALQHPDQTVEHRIAVAERQQPFAMVFACADSRESPEIIFDYGLGDLFVIRTAGHVLDAASLGSLEYGVLELKIPLLVVLGHQRCGAVSATLDTLTKNTRAPGHIQALVRHIRPAAQSALGEGHEKLENAIRGNTNLTVRRLTTRSRIIRDAVNSGALKIVAARYGLDDGAVTLV